MKTYYVYFDGQCQTRLVIKVKAKNEEEAEYKAVKVYLGSYDIYADTEKPLEADYPILNEDGEYIELDEEE